MEPPSTDTKAIEYMEGKVKLIGRLGTFWARLEVFEKAPPLQQRP
jgi:hypothetical protein